MNSRLGSHVFDVTWDLHIPYPPDGWPIGRKSENHLRYIVSCVYQFY